MDYPQKDDIAIARNLVFIRCAENRVLTLNDEGELLKVRSEDANKAAAFGFLLKMMPMYDDAGKAMVAASWHNIRHVAAGLDHAVGLTSGGRLVTTGNTKEFSKSLEVRSWRDIAMVDACEGHVAGVTFDGHVEIATEAYGYGAKPTDYSEELHRISGARRIAVSWLHAAVLLWNGRVRAVGEREYCNVGQCERWDDVVDIDAFGCYYSRIQTVGLTSAGRVLHTLDNETPDLWRDVVSVSCGDQHIVSLNKDGRVMACGRNDQGQCEVGDWPRMVYAKGDFFSTIAIDGDGWVWMTPIGRTDVNVFS